MRHHHSIVVACVEAELPQVVLEVSHRSGAALSLLLAAKNIDGILCLTVLG